MAKKLTRKEILEAFGVTEEDLQKVFDMREEDIPPEYREMFKNLSRKIPPELIEEIKKYRNEQSG